MNLPDFLEDTLRNVPGSSRADFRSCAPGEHDLDATGSCQDCTFAHTEPETFYERFGEDQR